MDGTTSSYPAQNGSPGAPPGPPRRDVHPAPQGAAPPSYYAGFSSAPPESNHPHPKGSPASPVPANLGHKSVVEAYLLAFILGLLGAHHFYLHRYYWGIIYLFTFGLCGCGYLIDLFRVPCLVKEANDLLYQQGKPRKTLSDAYTLWFPMGLLGFHHYYLGNYAWGVLYTCTLGFFGIGWLVDAVRMPSLVRQANDSVQSPEKNLCLACSLCVSPLGVLGGHHYYLNRPLWGLTYTLTLGLLGVGWVCDWFRMWVLVRRANDAITQGPQYRNRKTLDDAYILWFPFGLLGYHHFYLERPGWGALYFFTLGIGGLGWLVDMCRMPALVKDANARIKAKQERLALVSGSVTAAGQFPQVTVVPAPSSPAFTNYGMIHPEAPQPGPYGYTYPPNLPPPTGAAYYPPGYQVPGAPQYMPGFNNMPGGPQYVSGFHTMPGGPQQPPHFGGIAPPPYQPSQPEDQIPPKH